MLVRDVMNSKPVTCQNEDTVSEAAREMKGKKISGMPVLDGDRLVGVISESDVLRLLSGKEEGQLWLPSPLEILEVPFRDLLKWEKLHSSVEDISKKKVSEVMHRDVRTSWTRRLYRGGGIDYDQAQDQPLARHREWQACGNRHSW